MRTANITLAALLTCATSAAAAVTPPSGYIYSTELLPSKTQGCVAAGPGGTFVGVGPTFIPNAQSIVLAKESGELRLIASGFNSLGDCAYDAAADKLYVSDNADNGDFGLSGPFGAQTGDTVFAIPNAATASGLTAPGLELLPPNSVPFASSIAVDASGNVFVSDSAGGGVGSIIKIVGTTPSTFVSAMDYASGLAIGPTSGNIYAAESLDSFDNQLRQFTPAGAPVLPDPLAGPSFAFGSYDLAFNSDGRILATGNFGGDVVSFNATDGTSTSFIGGLTFAGGITVDPFTHRVTVLSSSFPHTDEDRSLHRFTPIDQLAPGNGAAATECLQEAYGLQIADKAAECTDGAACDGDGAVNGACLFPIGFCLNLTDPGITDCTPATAITAVTFAAKPASQALAKTATQIAAALPLNGPSCFFSDGYYVPLKVLGSGVEKDGKATLKVTTVGDGSRKDSDTYKLVCHPAP